MDKPKTNGPDNEQKLDADEVPEKQLHRWKDEGGALPPEPEPKSEIDPRSGPATRRGE